MECGRPSPDQASLYRRTYREVFLLLTTDTDQLSPALRLKNPIGRTIGTVTVNAPNHIQMTTSTWNINNIHYAYNDKCAHESHYLIA
jgi:hypothetical protein